MALAEGSTIDVNWVAGRDLSEPALMAFLYRCVNVKVLVVKIHKTYINLPNYYVLNMFHFLL